MTVIDEAIPSSPVSLAAGDQMPEAAFGPLTRTDIVRYAGASGDFNPIHHDEGFARDAGMPSVFGIGMHTAGILGQRLAEWVGPESIASFGVRFTGQVWPDDVLTFSGGVEEVESADGGEALASISLSVSRQGGDEVLRGRATVRVTPGAS